MLLAQFVWVAREYMNLGARSKFSQREIHELTASIFHTGRG